MSSLLPHSLRKIDHVHFFVDRKKIPLASTMEFKRAKRDDDDFDFLLPDSPPVRRASGSLDA